MNGSHQHSGEDFATPESGHPRVASAWVQVILLDSNDNHPKLVKQQEFVSVPEDARIGTLLEIFQATDSDSVSQSKDKIYIYIVTVCIRQ